MVTVLILLLPAAAAMPALQAESVSFEGAFFMQAGFEGLFADLLDQAIVSAPMVGEGAAVHVEVVRSHLDRSSPLMALSKESRWTESLDHEGEFRIRPIDGLQIMIVPVSPGSATLSGAVTEASYQVSVGKHTKFRGTDKTPYIDGAFSVGTTVSPRWDPSVDLALEGDFRVLLWDAYAELGDTTIRAGDWNTSFEAPLGVDPVVVYQYDVSIVEITVTGGHLGVPVRHTDGGMFLSSVSLSGSGVVIVEGTLQDGLAGEDLRFLGDSEVDLSPRTSSRLDVVPVSVEGWHVDGDAVVPIPMEKRGAWWVWIPGLLLVFALAAVPLGSQWRLRHLDHQLARRQYRPVAWSRGLVFWWPRTASRAALFKATALLVLGQYAKAGTFLDGLVESRRPDAATFHLLRAHAAAAQGDMEAARRDLRVCLGIDPTYLLEASAIQVLRPLVVGSGGESYV